MAERTSTCPYCSSSYVHRRPRANCGEPECRRLHTNAKMREFFENHRERTGEPYTRRYQEKRRVACLAYSEHRKEERLCEVCRRPWRTKRPEARFCSRRCQAEARFPGHLRTPSFPASKLPAQHPARRKVPKPPKQRLFVGGWCPRDGEPFIVESQLTSRYCSDRCKKAETRSTRKARHKGAFVVWVNRYAIFDRDGWRCQICKRKVRRSAKVPHPLAPVIDHITPLADGGTHEPANCQCAHFLCNSIKSDGAANDQLRLIG